MKEIVISKNEEDKKYCIRSFFITENEFNAHAELIDKFNETPHYRAFHCLSYNDYDEIMRAKCWHDSMEIIGYEYSENVLLPDFINNINTNKWQNMECVLDVYNNM